MYLNIELLEIKPCGFESTIRDMDMDIFVPVLLSSWNYGYKYVKY